MGYEWWLAPMVNGECHSESIHTSWGSEWLTMVNGWESRLIPMVLRGRIAPQFVACPKHCRWAMRQNMQLQWCRRTQHGELASVGPWCHGIGSVLASVSYTSWSCLRSNASCQPPAAEQWYPLVEEPSNGTSWFFYGKPGEISYKWWIFHGQVNSPECDQW